MREGLVVIALFTTSVIVGVLTSSLGWTLLVAVIAWLLWQAKEFARLSAWSQQPLRRPENGSDAWFNIAYGPYRALQRQRARTHRMARQLRQILGLAEFIPDGIIVLGAAAEIVGINQAAKKLLQLSDRDVGLGVATVVRQPDFVSFLRSAGAQEILEFPSPVDPATTLEARLFPVDEESSIVLIRDTTTLNKLLTMRQSFVANVSHELRTPLAVVQGYMETMTDPEEDPELKLELIDRLVTPLERMNSLVADLTLLTQLESPDRDPYFDTINLSGVIKHAVNELGGIDGLSSRVTLNLDDDTYVDGVESELQSVCVNLINNALKYSPEHGDITVSCRATDDQVVLSVADEGMGIGAEHIDRLTERFYRVDLAGAGARGGTGLGLAIVKHVLRRHGSSLKITSELGKGSTFTCAFTRKTPADSKTKEATTETY